MKKNILSTAALSLATAFILMAVPACQKNADQHPASKKQLLTEASWKFVKFEEKTAQGSWVDVTSTIDACEIDNKMIYRSNLTYELNEGATKCDQADPQIAETGTWSFVSNETKISFVETGSPHADVVDIVELTTASLILTKTYIINGAPKDYRVSFGH